MTCTDPAGSKVGAIPNNQLRAKRAGWRNCALHLRSRNIWKAHGWCAVEAAWWSFSRQRELVTGRRFAPNSSLEAHITRFQQ